MTQQTYFTLGQKVEFSTRNGSDEGLSGAGVITEVICDIENKYIVEETYTVEDGPHAGQEITHRVMCLTKELGLVESEEETEMSPLQVTKTIASHQITLEPGERYLASRPMAERGRAVFPVSISRHASNLFQALPLPVVVIDDLSFDEANELLLEFNTSGATSLEGRVWCDGKE